MLVEDIPDLITFLKVNLNGLKDAGSLNNFEIGYNFENERTGTDGVKEYDLNINIKAEPIKSLQHINIDLVVTPTEI